MLAIGAGSAAYRAYKRASGPSAVVPVSKYEIQNAQIRNLSRMVRSNKQQISNFENEATVSVNPATQNAKATINLTTDFTGSASYEKLVLGDKFKNKWLTLRLNMDGLNLTGAGLDYVRIVIYWNKKTGNSFSPTYVSTTADPAAFTVVFDRMFFPLQQVGAGSIATNTIRIPLKDKITTYNQSSSVLEDGELKMLVMASNSNATTARGIRYFIRHYVQNK